jgi:hypothetical protein
MLSLSILLVCGCFNLLQIGFSDATGSTLYRDAYRIIYQKQESRLMRFSKSEEVLKDKVEFEIQAIFAAEIAQLRDLHFTEEYYIRGVVFPFSAVLMFPVLIIMWVAGEKVQVRGWLQAVTYNPFLVHEDGYAYATVMKMGVKFVTMFDDGTMISTVTYEHGASESQAHQYLREECLTTDLVVAWKQHERRVGELARHGRSVIAPLGMRHIDQMEERGDRISFGFAPPEWDEKLKNKKYLDED